MGKTIKINNKEIKYRTVPRDVKYPRLELRTGQLVLILPKDTKNEQYILRKHKRWIFKKKEQIKKALENSSGKKLNRRIDRNKLKNFAKQKANLFSDRLDVEVNKIFVRRMKSKWASLSSKRNITINSYARFLPEKLIEYIIFHEVSHILVKKHNEKFWKLIEGRYANYEKYEDELFKYWFLLQEKMKIYSLNKR